MLSYLFRGNKTPIYRAIFVTGFYPGNEDVVEKAENILRVKNTPCTFEMNRYLAEEKYTSLTSEDDISEEKFNELYLDPIMEDLKTLLLLNRESGRGTKKHYDTVFLIVTRQQLDDNARLASVISEFITTCDINNIPVITLADLERLSFLLDN